MKSPNASSTLNLYNKISAFVFPSKQTLKNMARNYNNLSWYTSYRHLAIAFFITSLISGLINNIHLEVALSDYIYMFIFMIAIFFPFLYLSIKGWRAFLLITGVYFIADKIFTMWMFYELNIGNLTSIFFSILWGAIVTLMFINALRIENQRVRLKLKPKWQLKDIMIALSGLFILIGLAMISLVIMAQK